MPVRGAVTYTGISELSATLSLVRERLLTSSVVTSRIALLFEEMERQLFAGQGVAPEFGYTREWASLADSTTQRRGYEGISSSEVLVAFGYLRAAAINPRWEFIGKTDLILHIDPRNQGAPIKYSHGRNYGIDQNSTQRQFAYITPEFRLFALNIARNYFLGPLKEKFPVPNYAGSEAAPAVAFRKDYGRPTGSVDAPKPITARGSATEGNITGPRVPQRAGSMPVGYATFENKRLTGANLDPTSAMSRNLQLEYQNVNAVQARLDAMSPRAAYGKTGENVILRAGFGSTAEYLRASKNVARYKLSNSAGNAH